MSSAADERSELLISGLAVTQHNEYLCCVAWDKRTTVRRSQRTKVRGMHIVYLGLTDQARHSGIVEPDLLCVGDTFRLLPGNGITFGRSDLCEVTVASEYVSRAHALIAFVPGGEEYMALFDLQSRSGTWVNGRNQPLHLLGAGSEFCLGNAFRFRCQPATVK